MTTNNLFLHTIFNTTPAQNVLVHAFTGTPDAHKAWGSRLWKPAQTWDETANNYSVVSTFSGTRRIKTEFKALHVVMIDDVIGRPGEPHKGGKIERSKIPLAPTWAIETSKNNFQFGYVLAEPITDLHIASRLISAVIDKIAAVDPGMAGVTRYFKLPQGINGKTDNGFVNQLGRFKADLTFTFEQLVDAFNLDSEAITNPPLLTHAPFTGEDDVEAAVAWYSDAQGGLKAETDAKYEITCPWLEEHTDALDDGCCIGKPGTHPDIPDHWFKCHHGSHNTGEGEKRLVDFMRYCREAGFNPGETADEAFTEYFEESCGIPQEEEESDSVSFDTFSWADVKDDESEPPRQLIEELLAFGEMSLLVAQPNTGKSALALDMAIHLAAGKPWQGLRVTPCRCLYVAAESPKSIHTRIRAQLGDWPTDLPLDVVQERTSLVSPADRSLFRRKLAAYKAAHPDLGFVVLDTFRNATPGVAENESVEIAPVLISLYECAQRLDIHLMVNHHTTKAGTTYAGSGVFGAIVDTEIVLRDETDTSEKGHRGAIVAYVKQQRGLSSRGREYFYTIEGVKTGRITNLGTEETAPIVCCVSASDMAAQTAVEEFAAQAEAEDLENADIEALVDVMRRGANTVGALQLALGWGRRHTIEVRELAADKGVIVQKGEGKQARYVVVEEEK